MPGGINGEINIASVTAQIDEIQSDIHTFERLLTGEVDKAVRQTAEEFREEVKRNIEASDIDSDTGELLNSWKVMPSGVAKYWVHSTADHAVFLELGTDPHDITANDGGWLKFQPQDTSGYPERDFTQKDGVIQGDFAKEGLVVSPLDPLSDASRGTYFAKRVRHPGNEAYRYFEAAYRGRDWQSILNEKLEDAAIRAMEEAGL